jgi:peptidoglycan/xylan/chitin deacetylase (PgdA/CDA1 family)
MFGPESNPRTAAVRGGGAQRRLKDYGCRGPILVVAMPFEVTIDNTRLPTASRAPGAVRHAMALLITAGLALAGGRAFAAAPLVTSQSVMVPILVYHSVRERLPGDGAAARQYTITPSALEGELRFLKQRGFVSVGFDDLAARIRRGTPLPTPSVVISFDDGWETQYTTALPLLVKYGFKATFFIITGTIGGGSFMSIGQLRELVKQGMWIGCHTESHSFLGTVTRAADLRREIIASKRTLERRLGVPVTTFAYPYGQCPRRAVDLVKKAGYTSARGTRFGLRHDIGDLFTLSGLVNVTSVDDLCADLQRVQDEVEAVKPGLPPPEIDPSQYIELLN